MLHSNALFGEISAPVERQSGVDYADVDSLPVVTNSSCRAEVGDVDSVQSPVVRSIGQILFARKVKRRIRICSLHVG
jgi:hypothetical protein